MINRFYDFIRIDNIETRRSSKNQLAIFCFECSIVIELTVLKVIHLIIIDDRKTNTVFVLPGNGIAQSVRCRNPQRLMIVFKNIQYHIIRKTVRCCKCLKISSLLIKQIQTFPRSHPNSSPAVFRNTDDIVVA